MTPKGYTEDALVEQPAIALFVRCNIVIPEEAE